MHHPTDRIAHTTAFVTPVVEHWLERDSWYSVRYYNDPVYISFWFSLCSIYFILVWNSILEKGDNIALSIWYFPFLLLIGKKGRKCLFNDALNTFYLRFYDVEHMVKDQSDSKRGIPLPPDGLLFPIGSKSYFIWNIPRTGYHIPQALLPHGTIMRNRSDDPSHHERTLYHRAASRLCC